MTMTMTMTMTHHITSHHITSHHITVLCPNHRAGIREQNTHFEYVLVALVQMHIGRENCLENLITLIFLQEKIQVKKFEVKRRRRLYQSIGSRNTRLTVVSATAI
jgi:hypothetical protein